MATLLFAPPASLGGFVHSANNTSATASGYGGTARVRHSSGPNGQISLAVLFQNYSNNTGIGENTALSAVTYTKVVLEYTALNSGGYKQLYFNGQPGITIDPGGQAMTTPVCVYIPPNTTYYIRYYATWPANGSYTIDASGIYLSASSAYNNMASPAAGDFTLASGTTNLSVGNPPGQPVQILGDPAIPNPQPVIVTMGDSLYQGVGSGTVSSAPVKAFIAANAQFAQCALGNDRADYFSKMAYSVLRATIIGSCHVAVCNYGSNDISANYSNALVFNKANILKVIQTLKSLNVPVWYSTIMPRPLVANNNSSPKTNQTLQGFESVRVAINAWIRAPYSAGANNSLRYDSGGWVVGIHDTASYVESDFANTPPGGPTNPSNGGYWYTGPGDNINYSSDGAHPGEPGYVLMQAAFDVAAIQASARPYTTNTSLGVLGLTAF